jgi:hypothetical protein
MSPLTRRLRSPHARHHHPQPNIAPAAVPSHASSTASTPALRIVRRSICVLVRGRRLFITINSGVLHLIHTTQPIKAFHPLNQIPLCRATARPPGRPRTHAHQTTPAAITFATATPLPRGPKHPTNKPCCAARACPRVPRRARTSPKTPLHTG